MRRMSILIIAALTWATSAQGRIPPSVGHPLKPISSARHQQRGPSKGTLLVNRLPDGVRGVTIKNGAIRLLPGYKFVPHSNGTITVDLDKGGTGGGTEITGTWSCKCTKDGFCAVTGTEDTLSCEKPTRDPCSGKCLLQVTWTSIKGPKKIAFFD